MLKQLYLDIDPLLCLDLTSGFRMVVGLLVFVGFGVGILGLLFQFLLLDVLCNLQVCSPLSQELNQNRQVLGFDILDCVLQFHEALSLLAQVRDLLGFQEHGDRGPSCLGKTFSEVY